MNHQANNTKTTIQRAGAVALAALASLTVAVGCGGGEDSAPSADDIDIAAQLEAGGLKKVTERTGDDQISYIGEGADEREITSEESYSATAEDPSYEVFVERFATPEDATAVAEEYDDDIMDTEIVSDRIVVFAEGGEAFDQTLAAVNAE